MVGGSPAPEVGVEDASPSPAQEIEPETDAPDLAAGDSEFVRQNMDHLLPCVEFEEDGYSQLFVGGGSSRELRDLAQKLMTILDGRGDTVAGLAYCSHYDGMAVFVTPDAVGSVEQELGALEAEHPKYPVRIYGVPRSENEMLALMEQLTPLMGPDSEIGIMQISPDIYTGGLMVDALSQDGIDAATVAEAIKAVIGPDVPLIITLGAQMGEVALRL